MRQIDNEKGFGLIEILMAIGFFSFIAISITFASVLMMNTRNRTEHQSVASQIAIQKLEEMASIDPTLLSDADDSTSTQTRDNMNFTRVVDVTPNADGSRTIAITVTSQNAKAAAHVSLSETFPMWGSK